MHIHTDINNLPHFKNAVITIGTFDGVHKGHQQIIGQLLKEAGNIDGTAVLITFYPHPKQVVSTNNNPLYIINTAEEKYNLLHEKGIEHIVVVPFDKSFAEQSALVYIENFLVQKFSPHTIIIGYDHRFGNNREGGYQLLEKEAEKYGFVVKEIPEHILKDVTISSTKIRTALLSGDIDTAADYLGYPYFFSGKVVQGNQLGRTIGYPTANLQIENEEKLIPANGVYAVGVAVEGRTELYKGMMNIGVRPTVDGTKRVIEVNIFDFDEMIYGQKLVITLQKHLRNEVKFNGLDELKAQLAKDKEHALASFLL
ncbi:MAG: bifunctional riboflavin kinase/FAD synthetase [Sphingobacteriales bacterium]|nr:MAG: bifunctional riboflavin kinase/FAD synthetase [Sphingobacteriales bacterium]